jgi:hypothetical protein
MRRNQPLEPMVEVVSFTATLRCRLSGIALRGIKGDRLLFAVAIARGGVIGAAHAENPARAASWFCLSCDQPRKWLHDYLSIKLKTTRPFFLSLR